MKKSTKILALVLVCTLMMGTGYAYWSDDLNITGKVTTGNMDVTFVDLGYLAQYTNEQQGWSIIDGIGDEGYVKAEEFLESTDYALSDHNSPGDYDYATRQEGYNKVDYDITLVDPELIDVTIEVPGYTPDDPYNTGGSDEINVCVNNIYPGYAQAFRTDILNNGNIAATLEQIRVDVTKNDDGIKDSIGLALLVKGEYGLYGSDDLFKLAYENASEYIFTLGGVDFVRLSAFEDPSIYEDIEKTLLCIPSRNRMDLYMGIAMDTAAENDTMNGAVEFTIDLDWTQFNEGIGVDAPANILKNQNQ